MRTQSFNTADANRRWFVIDLDGLSLGRAASQVASILRGKNKPTYTPHADTGDFVIVINAAKAKLTGNKLQSPWRWHTDYMGHLFERTHQYMMDKKPDFMFHKAVKGMLPKGPLGRAMLRKLKIYTGTEHPHEAQKPVVLDIREK